MKKSMPFSFIPEPLMERISFRFYGLGNALSAMFPAAKANIYQSKIGYNPTQYFARSLIIFLSYALLFWIVLSVIALSARMPIARGVVIALFFALVLASLIFFNLITYPKLIVERRTRDIERNWVYALRTLLVQVKSGLGLFEGMNVIVQGDYGAVSTELRKAVDEINTGTSESVALEKVAEANPSLLFKRSIWQVINGMEAGISVEDVLASVVQNMIEEEKSAIRKYGSSLGLFSLLYVMLGVIIPALGITFMIVLSTFPQLKVTETLFWLFLGVIVLAQFLYIGFIKSVRPSILG
jgi:pilus assembly protein TadC